MKRFLTVLFALLVWGNVHAFIKYSHGTVVLPHESVHTGWETFITEKGDTLWDYCRAWGTKMDIQTFNPEQCAMEALTRSHLPATHQMARSLPVGTMVMLPSLIPNQRDVANGIYPNQRKIDSNELNLGPLIEALSGYQDIPRQITALRDSQRHTTKTLRELSEKVRKIESTLVKVPTRSFDQQDERDDGSTIGGWESFIPATDRALVITLLIVIVFVTLALWIVGRTRTQRKKQQQSTLREAIEPVWFKQGVVKGHLTSEPPLQLVEELEKLPTNELIEIVIMTHGKSYPLRFLKEGDDAVRVYGVEGLSQTISINEAVHAVSKAAHEGRLTGL